MPGYTKKQRILFFDIHKINLQFSGKSHPSGGKAMIMIMLLVITLMMKLTQLIITMTRIKMIMPMTMMEAMTIIAIASSHWNVLAAGPKS